MTEVLPLRLGKYQILSELGRGGMGIVYLAEDTTLCRKVALKAIFPQFSADGTFLQRFRDEARALASMSHASIVRINSLETIDARLFIDMEYVDGASLADQLSTGPMEPARAVEVAAVVLQALVACHARGITHRDIKPSNILIDREGRVVLTDFGLSQAFAAVLEETVTRSSSAGFFQGTPRYAPPEAWDGVPATPAWDLFSVGAILFEALAGRPLYDGATPMAIMKQTLADAPLDFGPRHVSPPLRVLLGDLLARNPAQRLSSAIEVIRRLAETPEGVNVRIDGGTALSWTPPPRRSGKLFQPRRPIPMLIAFGLALVVLLIAGSYLLRVPNAAAPSSSQANSVPDPAPAPAAYQSKVLAVGLPDENALLALRRFDSDARALDVELIEDNAASTGYGLLLDVASSRQKLILAFPAALWNVQLEPARDGARLVVGDWADYVPDKGMLFRWGTIEGTARGTPDGGNFTANLKVENKRANTVRSLTLSVRERAGQTDTAIIARMETEPIAQRLLWRELLPQASRFPWAVEVKALLPAIAGARVVVPGIAEPGAEFQPDGRLDESLWTTPFYNSEGRIGELSGRPADRHAAASFRVSESSLYVGGEILGDISVLRVVLCQISMGSATTSQYELVLEIEGVSQRCLRDGKEVAALANARASMHAEAGATHFEVRLPLADLGLKQIPGPFDPWRIVIHAETGTAPHDTRSAEWGWPRLSAPLHGALLEFQSAPADSSDGAPA